MNRRTFVAVAMAAGASGLASAAPEFSSSARAVWRRALVVDGNIGPPITSDQLPLPAEALAQARASGVSAIKTTMGGFNAPFEDTLAEIAFFQRLIETHPDVFTQIRVSDDFTRAKRAGQVGIIFSFESVVALEDKLDRIDLFRNLGVRVMQLSYNLPSPFGAGVLSPPDKGLTDLGRQAIERMNAQGVALDLSHSNALTTSAALAAAKKPVLITHAGCTSIHDHPRHKTDAQLKAVADTGGVVGIYDLPYLTPPPRQPTVEDYLAHMTHALKVCGEDHVGVGSDTIFGGLEMTEEISRSLREDAERRRATGVAAPGEDGRPPLTEGLNRPDRTLVIADGLMKRGYSARVAEKVLGANFVRAFREIW